MKAGLRVVRFTYRQLDDEPDDVGGTIAALLSLNSAHLRWGSRAVKGDGLSNPLAQPSQVRILPPPS